MKPFSGDELVPFIYNRTDPRNQQFAFCFTAIVDDGYIRAMWNPGTYEIVTLDRVELKVVG